MVEVLRYGYRLPFRSQPHLSPIPQEVSGYAPDSFRGKIVREELRSLILKGAIEPASTAPVFYSRLFVVQQESGKWRPIIDLSTLNNFLDIPKFKMETQESVLASIRKDDWFVSVDLKDAYLQVPVHQEHRRYLRFMVDNQAFQFRVLPFGSSTAPQVFTRIMAPISRHMHSLGFRLLRYLDDWLLLGLSRQDILWAKDTILTLCGRLGIHLNYDKSSLIPTQTTTYLGMVIQSQILRAFPSQRCLDKAFTLLEEFCSSTVQPVEKWRSLLGTMSSLSRLVPGSRLRMRSLQLQLNHGWDHRSEHVLVSWDEHCLQDLLWWLNPLNLNLGVVLRSPELSLHLYTDASDAGWGATVGDEVASGHWMDNVSCPSITGNF